MLAGLAYFGCVFGVGFALGVLRTTIATPLLGQTLAVGVELPIILVIAWAACRRLTARYKVCPWLLPRAAMGATAFLLLMMGEALISLLLVERSLAAHIQLYQEASHLMGLAGQVAFASFPVLQGWIIESPLRKSASEPNARGNREQ